MVNYKQYANGSTALFIYTAYGGKEKELVQQKK